MNQLTQIYKTCKGCNLTLEEEKHFYRRRRNSDKFLGRCISCDNLRRAKYVVRIGPKGYKTIRGPLLESILCDLSAGLNMKETALKNNINYYALLKFNKMNPLKTVNINIPILSH